MSETLDVYRINFLMGKRGWVFHISSFGPPFVVIDFLLTLGLVPVSIPFRCAFDNRLQD